MQTQEQFTRVEMLKKRIQDALPEAKRAEERLVRELEETKESTRTRTEETKASVSYMKTEIEGMQSGIEELLQRILKYEARGRPDQSKRRWPIRAGAVESCGAISDAAKAVADDRRPPAFRHVLAQVQGGGLADARRGRRLGVDALLRGAAEARRGGRERLLVPGRGEVGGA